MPLLRIIPASGDSWEHGFDDTPGRIPPFDGQPKHPTNLREAVDAAVYYTDTAARYGVPLDPAARKCLSDLTDPRTRFEFVPVWNSPPLSAGERAQIEEIMKTVPGGTYPVGFPPG